MPNVKEWKCLSDGVREGAKNERKVIIKTQRKESYNSNARSGKRESEVREGVHNERRKEHTEWTDVYSMTTTQLTECTVRRKRKTKVEGRRAKSEKEKKWGTRVIAKWAVESDSSTDGLEPLSSCLDAK